MKRPLVLDVGSGRGELIAAALNLGVPIVGLEFAPAMIDYVRDKYGFALIDVPIESYAEKHLGEFDAVVLNAVIEHVYHPETMMRAVSRILKPGGIVYIDTPNEPQLLTIIGNFLNKLLLRKACYNLAPTWTPYHIYGFNRRSMEMLLNKNQITPISFRVRGDSHVSTSSNLKGRILGCFVELINYIGNKIGLGNNMYFWARKNHTKI